MPTIRYLNIKTRKKKKQGNPRTKQKKRETDMQLLPLLETVELHLVLCANFLLNQKLQNLLSLVTLQLDNLTKVLIFNYFAVACEFFLEELQDTFLVELDWDTLDCCDGFTTVTLLNTNI
jgi:hypothetical protein